MKAVVWLDIPEYQIGQEVSVYFHDSMVAKGICEKMDCTPTYSEDYAIKVLNDIKKHYQLQAGGFQYALDTGIKAIQGTLGWNLCEERYPSPRTEVIVTVLDDHGDNPYTYTTVAWRLDDTWISDNDVILGEVIAWMPLPDPYNKKK